MADLSVKYLGLNLENPIVVSSSGLTNSVSKIEKLESAGAGAVVLKSLFEEQINHEVNKIIYTDEKNVAYPEAEDYIRVYTRENSIEEYLNLIRESKSKVDIPVIASIHCFSNDGWMGFAKKIADAGADALELNMFILDQNKDAKPGGYEEKYYSILREVLKVVKIPVSVKLGPYFSSLTSVVNTMAGMGAKGVVLFNRFYEPDIDIDDIKITASEVFSSPADIRRSLRWTAIVSSEIKKIDIAASTGVHDGRALVKQLLAGAFAVQICSVIYKNGDYVIHDMLEFLTEWMVKNGYETIDRFRGFLNYKNIPNPELYERSQFMKYFSSRE